MVRRGYRLAEGIEIFEGGAALLVNDNALIVADMHLGCEAALEYEGLSIPRIQTNKIEKYMADLIGSVGPRRVIVAGDLKHNFSRNLVQEWKDISRFVETLTRLVPLEVIRGNHDNFLGIILNEFGMRLTKAVRADDMTIVHGHEPIRARRNIVMGHVHPSVRLRDGVGAGVKDPCFLWEDARRILVLPALSIVASGVDVASQLSAEGMSPILSDVGLSSFRPIVFSGDKALRFPTVGEMRAAL